MNYTSLTGISYSTPPVTPTTMEMETVGGPFVTVVSVDGGSSAGNKLTVRTPGELTPSPCDDGSLASIPFLDDTHMDGNVGGGAYVTVVALKEKFHAGEKTSIVNILNEVEESLKETQEFEFLSPGHHFRDQKQKSVVSIEDVEEDLIIYRLPGERLGLGLRFEGGDNSHSVVNRLFIESCAEGSPAERTVGSWGPLENGDEVLAIGGFSISARNRQEWIDFLRESPVALSLRIRHLVTQHEQTIEPPSKIYDTLPNYSHHLHYTQEKWHTSSSLAEEDEDDDIENEEVEIYSEDSEEEFEEEESHHNKWTVEEVQVPVPPPRRLNARDSLKYYKNQRPASLHLEPPEGFEDFHIQTTLSESLEIIPKLFRQPIRSRSSLGQETPLEPPPSFQDEVGKRGIVRSRSLVNITHEQEPPELPEDEHHRRPNHPQQQFNGGQGDETDENEELLLGEDSSSENEDHGDPHHPSRDPQEGIIELGSFTEDLDRRQDPHDDGLVVDDGEVTIRIEWLHEIEEEEEEISSPSPQGGEAAEEIYPGVIFTQDTEHDNVDDFREEFEVQHCGNNGGRVMNEILLLRTLPLATIQFDQNPTLLPLSKNRDMTGDENWSEGVMETSVEFQFLPPAHARLPPDGHESPNNNSNTWTEENYAPPPLPTSQPPDDDPPPLPTSGPPTNQPMGPFPHKIHNQSQSFSTNKQRNIEQSSEPENDYSEPSIISVKDKIALFSSSIDESGDTYQPKRHESSQNFPTVKQRQSVNNNNNNNTISFTHHHMLENSQSTSLLEERRKSLSRLRGLVLTEKAEPHSQILDLPPIRSKDAPLITATIPKLHPISKTSSESNKETPYEDTTIQWRSPLPKYSPAFKRRTLTPYSPKTTSELPPPKKGLGSTPSEQRTTNFLMTRTTTNGKDEKEESDDNDSAISSTISSLQHEISPTNSPPPIGVDTFVSFIPKEESPPPERSQTPNTIEESTFSDIEDKEFESPPQVESDESPLQAIFDMERQMAFINEICDALPSSGRGFFHKRRDSEATVIERPIRANSEENERKSPGRESISSQRESTPSRESRSLDEVSSSQWSSKNNTNTKPHVSTSGEKTIPKITGILEKKIERIIEKTNDGVSRLKATPTSIPRGRNDFKSLSQKWQQISTQTNPPDTKGKEFTTPQRKRTMSVTDIRKAFEKAEDVVDSGGREESKGSPPELLSPPSAHFRVSSFDSTTSEESNTPGTSLLSSVPRDPYGSITSLASSTSLISPQELQQLIEEANQSLEEAGTPSHEVSVLILHREFPGGSLGITLAGGADYETKEITVHKVLSGSIADRDGRIHRGDRVLSINGKNTKGLTHRDALNLLKAPRTEVVLVVSRGRSGSNSSFSTIDETTVCLDRAVEPLLNGTIPTFLENEEECPYAWGSTKTVILIKAGAGLGFSLDGGKGSINGDKPLTIKKIFVGGPAEKSGGLRVGDLISAINDTQMASKSRTEAWNFMKKLGDGEVKLSARSPLPS